MNAKNIKVENVSNSMEPTLKEELAPESLFHDPNTKPKTIKKCLTLPGGGILVKWTVYLMVRLEEDLDFNFYDAFDCFAGTSSGAIIAGAVIARIPLTDLFHSIFTVGHDMFSNTISYANKLWRILRGKSIYDLDKLNTTIRNTLKEKTIGELANKKGIFLTTVDVQKEDYKIFSMNINKKLNTPDTALSDAVCGSSSLPFLLGEVSIKGKSKVIDGGSICPNPSFDVMLLDEDFINTSYRLLSISAPSSPKINYEELKGWRKVIHVVLFLPFRASETRTRLLVQKLIGEENCYFSQPTFPDKVPIDSYAPERFDVYFNEFYYKEREEIAKHLKKFKIIPEDRGFKYKVGEKHSLDEDIEKLIKERKKHKFKTRRQKYISDFV